MAGGREGPGPQHPGAYRRDLAGWEEWARRGRGRPGRRRPRGHRAPSGRARAARGGTRRRWPGPPPPCAACSASWSKRGSSPATRPPTCARPRLPRRCRRRSTRTEILGLLDSVSGTEPVDLRDRALLELLYGTGARITEVVGLSLVDLQGDDGLLRVFGKGAKERLVPLGGPARDGPRPTGCRRPGRPRLAPDRWAPPRTTPRRCSSTPGGAGSAARGPGPSSRHHAERVGLGRAGQPPRAAPLLRQPHAGPRGRHPGRPGAARATSPSPPPRSTPS